LRSLFFSSLFSLFFYLFFFEFCVLFYFTLGAYLVRAAMAPPPFGPDRVVALRVPPALPS
jgi:hypothetical protein